MNPYCSKIQQLWVEFLYEELPEDQAVRVRRHLAECNRCGEEFERCQRTLQTINAATRDRPQGMPTAGLLQRLNRQIDTRSECQRPQPSSRLTLGSLAMAAAFLLGVFAAPFLYQWYSNRETSSPRSRPSAQPIYSNITGANPLIRAVEDREEPSALQRLHQPQDNPLPAIEEELDKLIEPATLGRRPSGRSGWNGSKRSGAVISSTPERF